MQLAIPITKAKRSLTVDTDALFEVAEGRMYALVLQEGLKVLLNKGMTGDGFKTKDLEGDDLEKAQEAVFEKAEKNLAKLLAGEYKVGRGTTTDASGAKVPAIVITEAKRLAKEVLKDRYRNETGRSPSQVEAKVWTEAATQVIKDDPSYIEQAKANIDLRKQAAGAKVEVDKTNAEAVAQLKASQEAAAERFASLGISASPKLVKKAEEEKAARKKDRQLSAAKAGQIAPRKKPQASQHVH